MRDECAAQAYLWHACIVCSCTRMPVFVVRDCVKIVEDYKTKQTYLHVHVYLLSLHVSMYLSHMCDTLCTHKGISYSHTCSMYIYAVCDAVCAESGAQKHHGVEGGQLNPKPQTLNPKYKRRLWRTRTSWAWR
jgi:hypothetical protein